MAIISRVKESPRLAVVDGLRAMAMLMVFAFHTWEFANKPHVSIQVGSRSLETLGYLHRGSKGVAVFMVLSGFCLFFPLCFGEERLRSFNWRTYALRRVRRIVPPYYAAIMYALLLHGIVALGRHLTGREGNELAFPTPFDLLTHVTFTHSLFAATYFGIVGAFWSLGLEAQFYLMFPLVVWAFARFGTRAIAAIIVISLFYRAVTGGLGVGEVLVVKNFFLGRWIEFGAGMGAALLVARTLEKGIVTSTAKGLMLAFVGLMALMLPVPIMVPLLDKAMLSSIQLSFGVGALLYALCTSTRPVHFLWSNRASAFLGLISYSFFLIHQPTMRYLSQIALLFGPKMSNVALLGVLMTSGFLLCLVISYGFFLVFERPFLKNWPRLWKPQGARAGKK